MHKRTASAFTIVELLVVIVIIGILAAITIISYTGISSRATISSMQSDLTNASTTLKLDYVSNGTFPTTLALANNGKGITQSQSLDNITYIPDNTSNPNNFCLQYRKGNNNYAVDNTSAVSSGACLQNLVTNGDFSNGSSGWVASNVTIVSTLNNEAVTLASAQHGRLYSPVTITNGHKYYLSAWAKTSSSQVSLDIDGALTYFSGTGSYERLSYLYTAAVTIGVGVSVRDHTASGWSNLSQKNILFIDLTVAFGAGNEPTKAQMDTIMSSYPNNWFNIVSKVSL